MQGIQGIGSGQTGDIVGPGTTIEHVITQTAGQRVLAAASDQDHRRHAGGQAAQQVVAGQIDDPTASTAQQDAVVPVTARGIDVDGIDQSRGIERIIAFAQVHHQLFDVRKLLDEPLEFDIDHASLVAADDEALRAIVGVQVQTLAGPRARKQREDTLVIDGAQDRLDRGCQHLDLGQLEAEDLDIEVEGENAHAEFAPDIAIDVGGEGQVEEVERPARQARYGSRVRHHGQDFRGAHLAIARIFDRDELAVLVPAHGTGLDVVEVSVHIELQTGTQTQLQHRLDADTGFQTDLDADAHLGLFFATSARHELAIAEIGQGPVIDVETIDHVQQIVGGHGLAHPVGVEAERQVRIGLDATEGIDGHAHGNRDHTASEFQHRGLGQQDLETTEVEIEHRHFIGEQRGIATTDQLGPVADVGQIGPELQA